MKVRRDFVTNSSSSSFIISKDDISYDKLLEILLEIANEEAALYWSDETHYENYDEIAYRYVINEGTEEKPYEYYDGWFTTKYYTNHFIIDNNDCGRYNWDAVDSVLAKHNIPCAYGYCD